MMKTAAFATPECSRFRHYRRKRGWLSQDDLILLLEGQRDIASIRASNEQIAMQTHLHSTLLRLFDVTLLALGRI